MEKVTKRKQAVLDVIDEQIADLEERLAKAQPMINELAVLRATRAKLLDERSTTSGGGRRNAQLTMETMILDLKTNGPSSAVDIAQRVGVDPTIVRSHLNRHKEVRYRMNGDNLWHLIGEEEEGEDDE
jgi:membrane-anchored protein YejM (alkaline phosphatase superfamily)